MKKREAANSFSAGLPVAVSDIDRELKKLWQETNGTATRASLINLAVYSEESDSLARNTEIVSQITEENSCRALVIAANRAAKKNHVAAWISAHCHVGSARTKQVCSEQISFALEGPCARSLPNIVFSHLDSDLPFYLWWQGEFHDPMEEQLWSWVDRLIYDSQLWTDVNGQMRLVEEAQADARQRVVLCDLNWTRLRPWRLALAQFFDHPAEQDYLNEIEEVEIAFAPGSRNAALLLAGWLAAQLGWMPADRSDDVLSFESASCCRIQVQLREKAGAGLSGCRLLCGRTEFSVSRRKANPLLACRSRHGRRRRDWQLLPIGPDEPAELLGEELRHGGSHRVYLRALQTVRDLF